MFFSDVHFHGLYGVDDGAHTKERMMAMIDAEYADGVRLLCFTPHFNPMIWGNNEEQVRKSFAEAGKYAREKYSDLSLLLGNELRYTPGCINWVREGRCNLMGDTRYLLVDFDFDEEASTIVSGVEQLLNTGYKPILAHAERYVNLHWDLREVERLRQNGVLIQLDTQSVTGKFGFRCKRRTFKILKLGLADIVSSDAHGLSSRPPGIRKAYEIICRKFGQEYADDVCYYNAQHYFGTK